MDSGRQGKEGLGFELAGVGFAKARRDVGFSFAGADLRIGKLRWKSVFGVDFGG